ncbi:MAG: protein-methionine-sulfoxide reductase catalytic subunit MsrP [Pseudomonadota bacterium]
MSKRQHQAQRASVRSSEITPERIFRQRRRLLGGLVAGAGAAAVGTSALLAGGNAEARNSPRPADGSWDFPEPLTPESIVTSYNNFYEFGMDKGDPARYADALTIDPWSVRVSGAAAKTGTFGLEDVLGGLTEEDRVYRFRCVEAWSMVVPWRGVPLAALLKQFEPTAKAKYVEFTTLERPSEMRGQRSFFSSIDWPYVEGLRIDEAMHPLALMVTGVYGKPLPKQNGAPLRLMVPWKYGFKSIKSIVRIRFTERQPRNTWQLLAPREYGFYANVNPEVPHPRWSQASERRLPSTLFEPNRRPTLPFNGYGEEVAGLYAGLDLKRFF